MIAAIRSLTGQNPKGYFGDSSIPDQVSVRHIDQEAKRVFRARVVNPKWLNSIKRHGYKGGLEMSATVDYLFGYDATAQILEDWMYEQVARNYILDTATQQFLTEHNPHALRAMTERMLEAADRGLWEQPDAKTIDALKAVYLESESVLEGRTDAG